MKSKVYLVGAGPGDLELLTVRAVNVLKSVNVILYDRLVSRKILKALPKEELKVYVGEGHGNVAERQDRIYKLIKKYSAEGLSIAWLQNGDPLLLSDELFPISLEYAKLWYEDAIA